MRDPISPPLTRAHPWHGVSPAGPAAGIFNVFVEIVPTDTVKYELDKVSGHLRLDRPQLLSSLCPTLYGFLPRTYCGRRVADRCAERTGIESIEGDGDPMDVCVLTERPVAQGNLFVHARPIGGLRMIDGNRADDKIVAILEADAAYGSWRELEDVPGGLIERVRHYFLSYKQRPDARSRGVSIAEMYDREEALEVIARSMEDYRERFVSPGALEVLEPTLEHR